MTKTATLLGDVRAWTAGLCRTINTILNPHNFAAIRENSYCSNLFYIMPLSVSLIKMVIETRKVKIWLTNALSKKMLSFGIGSFFL